MKAVVKEIQVCGLKTHKMLSDACLDYLKCIASGIDREKISFCIILPDGGVRYIIIRQEDDEMIAYGDFEGLPSFLDYSREVGKEEE